MWLKERRGGRRRGKAKVKLVDFTLLPSRSEHDRAFVSKIFRSTRLKQKISGNGVSQVVVS